jgi:hypothetical protein
MHSVTISICNSEILTDEKKLTRRGREHKETYFVISRDQKEDNNGLPENPDIVIEKIYKFELTNYFR